MENGWQVTCGLKLPGSSSSSRVNPSLEQIQFQEGRNQMNMNINHCILPHDSREQGLLPPQMKQTSVTSNILNFGSFKPIHPETGSSFRSLLSVPHSVSQYDFQRQSNVHSSSGGYILDTSAQSNVGTMPSWPLLQNSASFNARNGVDVHPMFPSRPTTTADNGSSRGLGDDLDAVRELITHAGSRNESGFNTSLQKGVVCAPLSRSTVLDASLQTPSSISKKQNSVENGCPRVFCMGACGDLLLSSTGLFGILCSCHGMHMSVSRFCEHSGLSDVNPGYAVRMDSGESIAQWRKVYLQKFGIRAPGDHRGWDWPEGLLATSGLANSSMAVAERRKVFDLSSLFNSSAETVNSMQPWNNVSTSRPQSTQEYSDQMLKTTQWENGCDHCNVGNSRKNSHNTADNRNIACPTLRSLTPLLPSGKEGSGDGCQSRSFNFSSSCENSFGSAFQNLQNVSSKADRNLKDNVILQRGIIPSSIELKLGQPSQLSWGSGSAVLSAVGPRTSSVQKTTIEEKLNNNLANANMQHIFCPSASDFSRTKESFQTRPLNSAPTSFQAGLLNTPVTSTNSAAHVEHWTDRFHNNVAMSVRVPPSSTSAGESLLHKQTDKRRMMNSHPSSPWTLHQRTQVDRSVVIDFSCNGDAPIRPFDINELASPISKSRNMDATCGHRDFNDGSESSCRLYAKQMASSGNTRNGNNCNSNSSALSAAKLSPLGMANMLSGVSGASNSIGNACNLAVNLDPYQHSNKQKNSLLSFRTAPTLQATSTGFTPLSAVLAPGLGSASFSRDVQAVDSHTSDESLRLLALKNVDKLCREKSLDASFVFNQQPRIHTDQRQQSKNCSISDLRAQGVFLDQGPFEGHSHGHGCPIPVGNLVSPPSLPDAGHKNGPNLGSITEEMTLFSESTDKCTEDPCNSQAKQQSSPSVRRREYKECDCKMVQRCYGGSYSHISARCNCNVHTVCSKRKQDCNGSSSLNGLKKHTNIAVVETPKYNSSRFAHDCVTVEKAFLVEGSQKGKELNFKLECRNSQWTDLPPEKNTVSKSWCSDGPVHLLDTMEKAEASSKELATKGTPRTEQAAELLKGKEFSDISSGCSTPAVTTQASNEFNIIDSCIVDAGHTLYENGQIADQGSGISRSCSSFEAIDSVRSSQLVCDGKTRSTEDESLTVLANVARHGLSNEFKLTNSKSNKLQNFTISGGSSDEVSNELLNENGFKPRKRKRTTKWKMLGASFTVSEVSSLPSQSRVCPGSAADHHGPTSEDIQVCLRSNLNSIKMLNVNSNCSTPRRRRSALSSVKKLSHVRDLNGMYNIVRGDPGYKRPLKGNDDSTDMPKIAAVEKLKQVEPFEAVRKQIEAEAVKGYLLHDPISDGTLKFCSKGYAKAKPVACGKYGIICDQDLDIDQLKPPKIVPLSQILKASKRCAKFEKKPVVPSKRKKNSIRCGGSGKFLDVPFSPPRTQGSRYNKILSCHGRDIDASVQETQQIQLDHIHSDDPIVQKKIGSNEGVSTGRLAALSKTKEIRMRSLYELSMRGNKSISADTSGFQNVMCAPPCGLEMVAPEDAGRSDGIEGRAFGRRSCRTLARHCSSLILEMGELCCVCGISNKDDANGLLECGNCSVRIHQACYGIARVPKGDWYCRPCRTSSRDVACVLCGYGGGAMTRAFGSRNVVRSLLKAWSIRAEPHIMSMGSAEALYVPAKMECLDDLESATYQPCPSIKPVVQNSIISGLFDPTVKQWIHMVCGLWTPGTRCPNVDTMSAFDVSGVSHLKEPMVCYLCKRPGGSCIPCRVETCQTHFHPWCAHQKGLLQSEVEGVDRDQVGFYGRCLPHANCRDSSLENENDINKADPETDRQEEPTCARTESYQGKQKGDARHHSSYPRNGEGGCHVTQVQLDAWIYINRHKLSLNRQPKSPVSDVDHDCRKFYLEIQQPTNRNAQKEYARYKQAKGWKHLVVYKSGIHALGLYTSRFIQRGAMVVEYVGEIVGHRVADKRETAYLSGKKLQYKSACYFFRIDKEQIIDATCKGGIARFVNHSCQPNCVAKVLTVRGEKKVVFFAQRDIYPGEEITYDYHFNHEDEGKKIPCLCNSKNCRRYLN